MASAWPLPRLALRVLASAFDKIPRRRVTARLPSLLQRRFRKDLLQGGDGRFVVGLLRGQQLSAPVLARGFGGPEKPRGVLGLTDSQSEISVAFKNVGKNPTVAQFPGNARPGIERASSARIVFLGGGDAGDTPKNEADNPLIAETFVNDQTLFLEGAGTVKVAAIHGDAAQTAEPSRLDVGFPDPLSDRPGALEMLLSLVQSPVPPVKKARQHIGECGSRFVADCVKDLLRFDTVFPGVVIAVRGPRDAAYRDADGCLVAG